MTDITEALEAYTTAWYNREEAHAKLIETRLLLETVDKRYRLAVDRVNTTHATLERAVKESKSEGTHL